MMPMYLENFLEDFEIFFYFPNFYLWFNMHIDFWTPCIAFTIFLHLYFSISPDFEYDCYIFFPSFFTLVWTMRIFFIYNSKFSLIYKNVKNCFINLFAAFFCSQTCFHFPQFLATSLPCCCCCLLFRCRHFFDPWCLFT